MPFVLARRVVQVETTDDDALRSWLMDRVRAEVVVAAGARPRFAAVWDDREEVLDLEAVSRSDPDADLGASFVALRSRGAPRRIGVLTQQMMSTVTGEESRVAIALDEVDGPAGRRWWVAFLAFDVDPTNGLGVPGAWQPLPEVADPRQFPDFLADLFDPPPGGRPAAIAPPSDLFRPDLQMAFGEIPAGAAVPGDPMQMLQFAFALAVGDLLRGAVRGTAIVRVADRAWEMWVLGDELPTGDDDLARYVANVREPVADGVAMVKLVVNPAHDPPQPAVSIKAEHGGHYAELWGAIAFPSGPEGPRTVPQVRTRGPFPVPEAGMWLFVRPVVEFVVPDGTPEA